MSSGREDYKVCNLREVYAQI